MGDRAVCRECLREMENRRVSGGTDGFFVKQLFSDDGEVHDVFVDKAGCDFGQHRQCGNAWIQGEDRDL